jgi:hypothetical protein
VASVALVGAAVGHTAYWHVPVVAEAAVGEQIIGSAQVASGYAGTFAVTLGVQLAPSAPLGAASGVTAASAAVCASGVLSLELLLLLHAASASTARQFAIIHSRFIIGITSRVESCPAARSNPSAHCHAPDDDTSAVWVSDSWPVNDERSQLIHDFIIMGYSPVRWRTAEWALFRTCIATAPAPSCAREAFRSERRDRRRCASHAQRVVETAA